MQVMGVEGGVPLRHVVSVVWHGGDGIDAGGPQREMVMAFSQAPIP